MPYTVGLALAATLAALLARRHSWRIRFEAASTVSVALQGAAVLILCPCVNGQLSRTLHQLTGLWNLEDFIAHTLYIGALASLLSMSFGRLDISPAQFQALVTQRIVTPMTLFVPLFLAAFIFGHLGKRDIADFWLNDPNKMALGHRMYWTIFIWAIVYLVGQTAFVLWKVHYGQGHIAALYLTGIALSGLGAFLLPINSSGQLAAWFLVRIALILFAVASMWSWRRRTPRAVPIPHELQP